MTNPGIQKVSDSPKESLFLENLDGIFLSFFSADSNISYTLSTATVNSANLAKVLLEAKTFFKATFEVKIIGSKDVAGFAEDYFQKNNCRIKTCIKRQSSRFSLVYFPKTGRIRLENETLVQNSSKLKVLIVDDSATIRKLLSSLIATDPELEVVAMAEKPSEVEALLLKFKPDVMTLDIHMPEMTGVDLLRKLKPKYTVPTVMITSISKEEGPLVLDALEAGAMDYIQKPSMHELKNLAPVILEKIKIAARSRKTVKVKKPVQVLLKQNYTMDPDSFIAIGSSTGGTEALKDILTQLPEFIPPIVIVQHIPAVFSDAFARRINDLCPFHVKEAEDGDPVVPGVVLIAAGGKQMQIEKSGVGLVARVKDAPPVNRHCPSVDVLFDSVAEINGKNILAIILTGMGADGAKGLLRLKNKGARTIAQNEESCVVFGMPRAAIQLGAAGEILALEDIAERILAHTCRSKRSA